MTTRSDHVLLGILGRAEAKLAWQIDGTVQDSSAAVIPNSAVTVRNTDQNTVVRTVRSDQQGHFTASLLAIGHYSLTVALAGFETSRVSGVDVHVKQLVSIPVVFAPGAISQTVNVTAASLGVRLDSAATVSASQPRPFSTSGRNFYARNRNPARH